MKNLRLLLLVLSGMLLTYCNDNIDEQLINVAQNSEQNYVIEDNFLKNEKLSENEVKFIAETFTSSNLLSTFGVYTRTANKVIIDNVLPLLSDDNQTLAYAVNFKGGGYNIVSATQKYSPIIGFSEKGSIQQDYREENPGLAFWLDFLKGDIVYQINKNDDSDSIAIMNRMLWREYEAVALLEKNTSVTTSIKDHWYWYNKKRLEAMDGSFTSSLKLMSEDLPRFREIVQTDYDNHNNLSTGEMNHLISTNTALKSEYSRAGLSQPTAYFWTEYYKGSNDYDIGNLIKTKWHQDYPYNILNPLKTNSDTEHQPAGCVTLAVAQVLNFYKHPQTLYRKNGIFLSSLDVDWNKTDITSLSDPNLLDIPTLIRFVNQGVFTENGDNGSSSNIDDAQSFFNRNQYTTHRYDGRDISRMISEIKAGRPVYVRGSNNSGEGHAFICDGYRAIKRHLYIELSTTNDTYVKDYVTNPYFIYKTSEGSRITSQEYLGFNWGWGYSSWVIIPSNSPIDFNGFNNIIKLLTIEKQ